MINSKACSGCAACEQSCPRQCIDMKYDAKGFLYPVIDEKRCIKCGICDKVCEKAHENSNHVHVKSYVTYAQNRETRENSSSGGLCAVLGKWVLENGGVVFGAVFDENFHLIHKGLRNVSDLKICRGSKYVQSDVLNTYKEVKGLLNENIFVLYIGTPCQIAGLYGFLSGKNYDNLVSASLICHGVPSPRIWDRYLAIQKANYNSAIKGISFREKNEKYGWGKYHLKIEFENGLYDEPWYQDLYFQGFEFDFFNRPSCSCCTSKGASQKGDLIIGDYWKAINDKTYEEKNGVNAVVALSKKGEDILNACKDKLELFECEYKYIKENNTAIDSSVVDEEMSNIFWNRLFLTENLIDSIKYANQILNQKSIEIVYQKKKGETVIVWGLGEMFDQYFSVLKNQLEIQYLCDSNEKLVGERINDIWVISQDDLKKIQEPYVIIMVDNILYITQIIKKLHELGIQKYDVWRTFLNRYSK